MKKSILEFQTASISPDFAELITKLGNVAPKILILGMVNPVNARAEEAKWLEAATNGHFTNPQFAYDRTKAEKTVI